MLFGLTNALMVFQQFINNLFFDLLDVCIIIYLDDIPIYSNNMSAHCYHIKNKYSNVSTRLVFMLKQRNRSFTPSW